MFDPFKQSKLMTAYNGLQNVQMPPVRDIEDLGDLKKLAGVTSSTTPNFDSTMNQNKNQYMRDNNIRPGDKEWFQLWFARPDMTGESPFASPKK